MGQLMKLRTSISKGNNSINGMNNRNNNSNSNSNNNNHNNNSNSNSNNNNNNGRIHQDGRSHQKNWGLQDNRGCVLTRNSQYQQPAQCSPKRGSRLRDVQSVQREVIRGTFSIIATVSCSQFVALEIGWQSAMDKLAEGLEDYANFAKCGVQEMDPTIVYACKDPVSGKWRRCRKVSEEGGAVVVDLIDHGGRMVVALEDILLLSQLYKDWSIKAVDLFLEDYAAVTDSNDAFQQIEASLLSKTVQLEYMHERTGPLTRDRVRVLELKLNGEHVLDRLADLGLLRKLRSRPNAKLAASTNGTSATHRPITKSSNLVHLPRGAPLGSVVSPLPLGQLQVDGQKPLGPVTSTNGNLSKAASLPGEGDWGGEWGQQGQSQGSPRAKNQAVARDGWGSVGLARDDIGTEVWNKVMPPPGNLTESWADCVEAEANKAKSWEVKDWAEAAAPETPAVAVGPSQAPAAASTAGGPSADQVNHSMMAFKPRKREDVFSDAGEWNPATRRPLSGQPLSPPAIEKLSVNEAVQKRCPQCVSLSAQLMGIETLVYGNSVQNMISERLSFISTELGQLKMHITRLSITCLQANATFDEVRHNRRAAQMFTQEIEDLILLASADTLKKFGMVGWSQFVGKIWRPMMSLLFFNEKPMSVYKNTVIRRAELDTHESFEEKPQITVVLERAIDASRIFQFAQDLMTHKEAAKVYRIFFSEDNSKAFVILDCPESHEGLEECGRQAVDFLLDSDIIQ